MKQIVILFYLCVSVCWSIPKPMESIEKYNVMLVHGTYESGKGIENCSSETPEAVKESKKSGLSSAFIVIVFYSLLITRFNWILSVATFLSGRTSKF